MVVNVSEVLRPQVFRLSRLVSVRRLHAGIVYRDSANSKLSSEAAKTFKNEEKVSNIQERTLFENVFERIMEKERQRELKRKDVLNHVNDIKNTERGTDSRSSNKKLQIVFGQDKKQFSESDKRMLAFFRQASETNNSIDDLRSPEFSDHATLTTDDIRKYPVSLVSSILEIGGDNSKELKADRSILGKFANIATNSTELDIMESNKLKIKQNTLNYLERKQRFNTQMETAMKPYIDNVINSVKTDHELFEYIQNLLKQGINDSKKDIEVTNTSIEEIPDEVRKHCEANPSILPSPLEITIPYLVNTFLTTKNLNIPSDRRYYVASYIYNECKKPEHLFLYLNVCNIDFYNILLKLTWDNFTEIYQLRQLIREMNINGVIGNFETIEILEQIVDDLRYLNDDIPDEPTGKAETNDTTDKSYISRVWCRDNSTGLAQIEKYLFKLKESLV